LANGASQLERKWPYPIVDFYLGKISRQQLELEANDDKKCELVFYTGEWELLKGDKEKAKQLLQKAANTCQRKMAAYDRAIVELKKMTQ
jgi:lipoprotein NlpI